LRTAQEMAPGNSAVALSLQTVTAEIERETALEGLRAAVLCAEAGMRVEATTRVKEAMRLSAHTDVEAAALKTLVKIGAAQEAIRYAKRLLQANPRDARAWDGLMEAYDATGELDRAILAAERLKLLRPKDASLDRRITALRNRL